MKHIPSPNERVKRLKSYRVDQTVYPLRLDANEASNTLFNESVVIKDFPFNRYPDHDAIDVRQKLAAWHNMPIQHIVLGNGSSELIELMFKTFLTAGEKVLAFDPTFSMYDVYAQMYGMDYIRIPWEKSSELSINRLIDSISSEKPQAIFLCTPNNPTGFQLKKQDIKRLLEATDALVVIDEAYIEFADQEESYTQAIIDYPHACVLRTFSKAFGLASIRLGYMIAAESITSWINRVRSPYHVNQVSQVIGSMALDRLDTMRQHVVNVIQERERVYQELCLLGLNPTPSKGNFIYIEPTVYRMGEALKKKGIIVREFAQGAVRITIGNPDENDRLIQAIKEMML